MMYHLGEKLPLISRNLDEKLLTHKITDYLKSLGMKKSVLNYRGGHKVPNKRSRNKVKKGSLYKVNWFEIGRF